MLNIDEIVIKNVIFMCETYIPELFINSGETCSIFIMKIIGKVKKGYQI
jgi:hypothetical protein